MPATRDAACELLCTDEGDGAIYNNRINSGEVTSNYVQLLCLFSNLVYKYMYSSLSLL